MHPLVCSLLPASDAPAKCQLQRQGADRYKVMAAVQTAGRPIRGIAKVSV